MSNFNFQSLVRENVKRLKPYSSARSEFTQEADIFIDANENPFETDFNRYPDPLQWEVKAEVSKIKDVNIQQIFLGNGSDEIIDLLMRCIGEPAKDNIITFSPSYTMYITSAEINDLGVKSLPLNADFSIPMDEVKKVMDERSKILFLCSPNNPVGNSIPLETVEECCQFFNGIVVVDEAYVDFSTIPSATTLLDKYANLLVLQTMSKAYGMAGLRMGMAFASQEIIRTLNKIKPPYNISSLSQTTALERLKDRTKYEQEVALLKSERERLYAALSETKLFDKIYPSDANFILVQTPKFKDIYDYLARNKVIARLRDIPPMLPCGLRFSIGTPTENTRVIELLKKYNS